MSINENKSGDSSLRDWFSKSRSSDGTPGWVQLGGKYAGKPCARQPGQKTKPKCGSSKMKRNLNKKEEDAAFRRKNRQDPNPDRTGKAKNVATEEMNSESYTIDARMHKMQQKREKIRNLASRGQGGEKDVAKRKLGKVTELPSLKKEATELRYCPKCKKAEKRSDCAYGESYWDKNAEPITVKEAKGEKDACYKKVKSRYAVWPSAYASGALVKCRKVGASNWGNKTKKESFEGTTYSQFMAEAKKCWKGYEKKGTQKLFGKTYNRCVKKEEVTNESAAWTRKAGKSKSGGLNEKGRKSYERENPGSDLKAPSKKVGNPRRASFCARMKGMKKKLTSSKTARDPDSRINKSLRAWNC